MYRKSFRGAWLLVAWMALAPAVAWGQSGGPAPSYAPASPGLTSWLPLGSTRPEDGGFFAFAQATYFKTDNPLKSQQVAVRGFVDKDGSVSVANIGNGRIGLIFGTPTSPFLVPAIISTRENGQAGTFFGSGAEAPSRARLRFRPGGRRRKYRRKPAARHGQATRIIARSLLGQVFGERL